MIPYRETQADVLVCGGGTAGVSAALSAAMNGMSVRILEKNGFFGGTLVSGLVGGFCGIYAAKHTVDGEPPLVVGGTARRVSAAPLCSTPCAMTAACSSWRSTGSWWSPGYV
jgi:NADPH-dependent 2,4-dienoyl-CoA reductase/sulfur reductase-like enzyme